MLRAEGEPAQRPPVGVSLESRRNRKAVGAAEQCQGEHWGDSCDGCPQKAPHGCAANTLHRGSTPVVQQTADAETGSDSDFNPRALCSACRMAGVHACFLSKQMQSQIPRRLTDEFSTLMTHQGKLMVGKAGES